MSNIIRIPLCPLFNVGDHIRHLDTKREYIVKDWIEDITGFLDFLTLEDCLTGLEDGGWAYDYERVK